MKQRAFTFDLRPFYDCDVYADVKFFVTPPRETNEEFDLHEEPRVFHAHKVVLGLASRPFAAMFQQPMREKASGTVDVRDTDIHAFELMLRYLYNYDIRVTTNNVFPLLEVAQRYQIRGLSEMCSRFLEGMTDSLENVYGILNVAMRYQCTSVIEKCCHKILSSGPDLLGSKRYLTLSPDVFVELLKSDHWSVSEDDVFDMCVDYATRQVRNDENCDIQEEMKPYIPYIRFPHMSVPKLFQIRRTGAVPESLLCDATFFKLGECEVNWLENIAFRHRQSRVEFCQVEGFVTQKDPKTQRWVVRRTGNGGRCVRTQKGMSAGRHEMNFKIIANPRDIIFGVMEARDPSLVSHESSGRMIGCHMQKRRHRGSFFSRPAGDQSMGEGDTVRLILDLTVGVGGVLSYSVNDQPFEAAFEDLLDATDAIEQQPRGILTSRLDGERRHSSSASQLPGLGGGPSGGYGGRGGSDTVQYGSTGDSAKTSKEWVFCMDMYSAGTAVEIL